MCNSYNRSWNMSPHTMVLTSREALLANHLYWTFALIMLTKLEVGPLSIWPSCSWYRTRDDWFHARSTVLVLTGPRNVNAACLSASFRSVCNLGDICHMLCRIRISWCTVCWYNHHKWWGTCPNIGIPKSFLMRGALPWQVWRGWSAPWLNDVRFDNELPRTDSILLCWTSSLKRRGQHFVLRARIFEWDQISWQHYIFTRIHPVNSNWFTDSAV